MQSPAHIYAVIFLIISTLSAVLGIIILTTKKKNEITWPFFAIAICLSIWSFGFSMAISAPNEETCLLWRRFSALGWGPMYAVMLDFTLSFTGLGKLKRYKWISVLHYAPAAVTVYIYALSNRAAEVQYQFVRLTSGWTNTAVNNGWAIFFYVYLALYVFLSIALLWHQWRKGPDKNSRRQARLLFLSFGAALVLGTLTDLVNSSISLLDIPQMAPVTFILPLVATYYIMNRYSFLNVETSSNEIILTNEARNKLMAFLAYGFVAGGVIYFTTQYYMEGAPLTDSILGAAVFIGFGCLLFVIRKTAIRSKRVETIFILSAIVSIPVVTMHFIQYAGITIWAFPFIFVVLSMLFNTRNLLIASSISIFLTQLLVWVNYPYPTVTINASDFVTRISIFTIAIWIAFYVNRVYIGRLRENVEQNKYQRLISLTSASLFSDEAFDTEEQVNQLLSEWGRCFAVDAAFVYLFDPADRTLTGRYVWTERNAQLFSVADGECCDLFCHLTRGEAVIDDTNAEAAQDVEIKPFLPQIAARSFLSLPLRLTDKSVGFLGLSMAEAPKGWRNTQIDTLRIISNNVSDSLTRMEVQKEMEYMAYHDFLTRLPNRLLFSDRTDQAIHLARRTEKQIGVMFLDLDAFKSINDTLGHRVGDELIKAVARKLAGCVRASDTVSRFGGDEFLLMFNNMSKRSDFVRVADTVMSLFNEPFCLQGQEVFITASAGIAIYPMDGEDTDTLIKNADIAMYNSKDGGKNRYLFCSQDMKEDVQYKARLTNNLYRVLERGELRVYYQPQISLQTNRIIGVEALLRWFHPELGLISPGIFIPLAEKTGLISSIGEWVLDESCRQVRAWQDMGFPEIRMAVNVSVNQLRNPQFVEQVGGILHRHSLAPHYLELEVTESAAIKESTYIITMLERLKQLGVFLSIDDFGTEYSSLSRLKQLPVDRIKMDMQFVQGIDKNEKDKAISKVIINLAKSLGMKVIAEGVETSEQLSFLNQRLCDEVQGYIYYKPMPVEEIEQIFKRMGPETGPEVSSPLTSERDAYPYPSETWY